jgi:DHA1 family tetracycline resistance protein-like MFS transporter
MMRVTLPFYAKALGGTSTFAGSLETFYGVGQIIGALTLPRLSDTLGRRTILVMSCAGSSIGYGIAIVARMTSSPGLLQFSRIPVGLSKQTVTVSRAVVADCTSPDANRSQWMALLGAALGVGCVVGPFVGGQTAEIVGETAPAIIATSIFVVLGPVVFFTLPETYSNQPAPAKQSSQPRNKEPPNTQSTRPSLWQDTRLMTLLFVLSLSELGLIAHASVTLYAFCINTLGKGQAWVGNLTSLSACLQAAFSGLLLPYISRKGCADMRVLQLGALSFALSSAIIALGQSEQAVMLSAPLAALANAVLRAYPATFLSKHVAAARQGEAMGLLDLTSSLLRVVAPTLAGWVMDKYHESAVFYAQMSLFALAALGLEALSLDPPPLTFARLRLPGGGVTPAQERQGRLQRKLQSKEL